MTRTIPRLVLVGLLFAAAPPGVAAPSPAPAPSASASPTPAPTPAGLALTEITPQGQTKLTALNGIESDDAPDKVTDAAGAAFRDLTARADALVDQGNQAATPGPGSSLDALRDQLAAWKKLQDTLEDQTKALGNRGSELENESREIDETQKLWTATRTATDARDANAPPEIRELVKEVLAAADAARKRVAARRTAVLSLQTTLGDLGTRLAAGLAKSQSANAEARKTLFVADSAPLWSDSGDPRPDFFARWRESAGDQWDQARDFSRRHWGLFAFHGAIFAGLLAGMFWLRRRVVQWTEEEPHLARAAPIFRVPVATALALSFVLKGNIYAGTPPLFRALIGAVALLPTVVILRRVLDRRLGLVVYSLVFFYAVDRLRLATAAFPVTDRWIFCVELAGAIVVYGLLTRAQRTVHPGGGASLGRWIFVLDTLATLVLALALGASVSGYLRLGTLLGEAVLFSSYLAVALYTLLRVVEGFIAIALRVRPITASRVVRQHREMVQDRAYRGFRAAAFLLWGAVTLDRFQVLEPLYDATAAALDHRLPLGAVNLTLGRVLAFGAGHLGVDPDLARRAVLSRRGGLRAGAALAGAALRHLDDAQLLDPRRGLPRRARSPGRGPDEDHHRRGRVLGRPGLRAAKHHQQLRLGPHPALRAAGEGRRRDPDRRRHGRGAPHRHPREHRAHARGLGRDPAQRQPDLQPGRQLDLRRPARARWRSPSTSPAAKTPRACSSCSWTPSRPSRARKTGPRPRSTSRP